MIQSRSLRKNTVAEAAIAVAQLNGAPACSDCSAAAAAVTETRGAMSGVHVPPPPPPPPPPTPEPAGPVHIPANVRAEAATLPAGNAAVNRGIRPPISRAVPTHDPGQGARHIMNGLENNPSYRRLVNPTAPTVNTTPSASSSAAARAAVPQVPHGTVRPLPPGTPGTSRASRAAQMTTPAASRLADDNPFRDRMEQHVAETQTMKGNVKLRLEESLKQLQRLNADKLAALGRTPNQNSNGGGGDSEAGLTPPLPSPDGGNRPRGSANGRRGMNRAEMRRAMLEQLENELQEPAAPSTNSAPLAAGGGTPSVKATTDAPASISALGGGGGAGTTPAATATATASGLGNSGALLSQIQSFKSQVQGMTSQGPAIAASMRGTQSSAEQQSNGLGANFQNPVVGLLRDTFSPGGGGAAGGAGAAAAPDMSSIQAQQAVLHVLQKQLTSWHDVASRFGALNQVIQNFGTTVKHFSGLQDDSKHYTLQTHRGPILSLLDDDSVRWYRETDTRRSLIESKTKLTWFGANHVPRADAKRRFPLEFSDMTLDENGLPIVVGHGWNPDTQLQTMVVGRFLPDGSGLDPTFAQKPDVLKEGWLHTNYFATRSDAVQVRMSHNFKRILVLGSVFDKASDSLTASVCAVRPSDSQLDPNFGEVGVQGLGLAGFSGSVGVAFSIHPTTGHILVLMRLQKAAPPPVGPEMKTDGGGIASAFVKLDAEGAIDQALGVVFIGSGSSCKETGAIWIATDIAWRTSASGAAADDRIIVVGSRVTDRDQQTSQAFVAQYLPNGHPDHGFFPAVATDSMPPSAAAPSSATDSMPPSAAAPSSATDSMPPSAAAPSPPAAAEDSKSKSENVGEAGVLLVQAGDAAVSYCRRVVAHDGILDIGGVAYPSSTQGASCGSSFFLRVDARLPSGMSLQVFTMPGTQSTVLRNLLVHTDPENGMQIRTAVGYCLHAAASNDSADAFIVQVDGGNSGQILAQHRISLPGDFFQTINAAAFDPRRNCLWSAGVFQYGRTNLTRLSCLLNTQLGSSKSSN